MVMFIFLVVVAAVEVESMIPLGREIELNRELGSQRWHYNLKVGTM